MKVKFAYLKTSFFSFLFGLLLLTSCSTKKKTNADLQIACAASTQFAMEELGAAFEEKYGLSIDIISSSSGKLSNLISKGAPYDLFFSADRSYIQHLKESGTSCYGEELIYGTTKLALYANEKYSAYETADSLLRLSEITKIAIADPASAPIGNLALTYLENAGLDTLLKNKLVYGNSIAQVNQYIEKGLCDAGFVSNSVIKADVFSKNGKVFILDEYSIEQSAIILSMAEERGNLENAQLFMQFVTSDSSAHKIMQKFGYR